jgi:hypothetical protein
MWWGMPAAWADSSAVSATDVTRIKASWHEYRETAGDVNIFVARCCGGIGKRVDVIPHGGQGCGGHPVIRVDTSSRPHYTSTEAILAWHLSERRSHMSAQHAAPWSRREFLAGLTLAGTAGILGLSSGSVTADPPPETKRLRLHKTPSQKIIAQSTDWRFFDELKRELKG